METMKDGTRINPSPVCQGDWCPEKSSARVVDLTITEGKKKWKDLCAKHARAMKRVYKEKVSIEAAWNELTMEEFDNE